MIEYKNVFRLDFFSSTYNNEVIDYLIDKSMIHEVSWNEEILKQLNQSIIGL